VADPEYVQQVAPSATAGTPSTAPSSTPTGLSLVWLHRVEVRIPAGHSGFTGLAMVDSGQYVLPYSTSGGKWLIGDNDLLEYEYEQEIGSNVLFLAYNTGTYNHTWQVRMTYTPMSAHSTGGSVIVAPDVAAWLAEIDSVSD
jgi:hypothetical protein